MNAQPRLFAPVPGLLVCLAFGAVMAGPSQAQEASPEAMDALAKLLACQELTDADARLACFDQSLKPVSDAFPEARLTTQERQVVAQQKAERRAIEVFGLRLGGQAATTTGTVSAPGAPAAREVRIPDELILPVAEVSRTHDRRVLVVLENGQVWSQTEASSGPSVVFGSKVERAEIRRKALGSFMMRLDNGVWFKARRVK